MDEKYIKPHIIIGKDLDDLIVKNSKLFLEENEVELVNICDKKMICLIGDPGIGKSRALKELMNEKKYKSVFLDLKLAAEKGIEEYLRNNFSNFQLMEKTEKIDDIRKAKSEDFDLFNEEEKILVLLDALDEVKKDYVDNIIDEIDNLSSNNKKWNIILSCRRNFLNTFNYLRDIKNIGFSQIIPFSITQVKEYLSGKVNERVKIEDLMKKVDYSILSTPRYLSMLSSLEKEELENISRTNIFKKIIDKKLEIEAGKYKRKSDKEIINNILGKIALIMKINATEVIKKEEFIIILDNVDYNLSTYFFSLYGLEFLYERSLLKDSDEYIEFENSEFLEFFASKEILNLAKADLSIYELCFVKNTNFLSVGWVNTISFILENRPDLINPIIEFIFRGNVNLHVNDYIILLVNNSEIFEKISSEEKRNIFRSYFDYITKEGIWLEDSLAERLASYFDSGLYEYINEIYTREIDEYSKIKNTNYAIINRFLIKKEKLNEQGKNEVKRKIKKLIKVENQKEVVIRECIKTLGEFHDENDFDNEIISIVINTKDNEVLLDVTGEVFIEINPNNEEFIDFLYDRIQRIYFPCYGIGKIDKVNSAIYILNKFSGNIEKFIYFLSKIGENTPLSICIKNNHCDKNLMDIIIDLFYKTISYKKLWQSPFDSSFFINLLNIIKDEDENFIINFFKKIKEGEISKNCIGISLCLPEIIAFFITDENIEDIKKMLSDIYPNNDNVRKIKISYEISIRKKELIEKWDKDFKKPNIIEEESFNYKEANKDEFIEIIQNKDGEELINIYRDNYYFYEEITLPEEIKEILKNKIIKFLCDFKAEEDYLKFSDNGYTFYGNTALLKNILDISINYGLNISEFRNKLIPLIYIVDQKNLNSFFEIVGYISEKEIKNIISIAEKKHDYFKFGYKNILELFKKHLEDKRLQNFLKTIFHSEVFDFYIKKEVLKTLALCNDIEEDFYEKLYKESKIKELELSWEANSILIEKFKNSNALDLRINEIYSKKSECKTQKKPEKSKFSTSVTVNELNALDYEIKSKSFAKPLIKLIDKDMEFVDQYLDLIKKSFEVYAEGENYYKYSFYLRDIAVMYLTNNVTSSFFGNAIEKIDRLCEEEKEKEALIWSKYKFREINSKYISSLIKSEVILLSVNKYNKLKNMIYDDINNSYELFNAVKEVLDKDIRNWIENEGAYKILYNREKREEILIQKTIKTQFEYYLGKKITDFSVIREVNLLNDSRCDIYVSYGFLRPIIIELKLSTNNEFTGEMKAQCYKKKLIKYKNGFYADYLIYLIFKIKDNRRYESHVKRTESLYQDVDGIVPMFIDCQASYNEKK